MVFSLVLFPLYSDDDEHEDVEHEGKVERVFNAKKAAPFKVNNLWKSECQSCHMLYPPSLMKAESWTKLMGGLKNHFGENAELDPNDLKEIQQFLVENSADQTNYKRGLKMMQTKNNNVPISISETDYFKRKHDEISPAVFKRKSIRTAANCLACHPGAERAYFEEDDVVIPKEMSQKASSIKK